MLFASTTKDLFMVASVLYEKTNVTLRKICCTKFIDSVRDAVSVVNFIFINRAIMRMM